jgi:hypothetical protein
MTTFLTFGSAEILMVGVFGGAGVDITGCEDNEGAVKFGIFEINVGI